MSDDLRGQDLRTPPSAPEDRTLRALQAGQLIAGRFRLGRILGKGGMGVVWLAQDERLGEPVAFKFVSEMIARDESTLFDLKREVKRSRQLTHPHIIRVHDLVEDAELGVAGITMELAAGGSLSARRATTAHGWFEPAEIALWVRQLCAALDYAHRTARVIHRDLKPLNLLLDREDQLKVGDFGIAAALHEGATRLTAGKISGTKPYMSPEQAQGYPPAPADDLYSLGATIYDLLAGKPPFYSGNVLAAAIALTPVRMSERRFELEGIEAPLPELWEETVAALLAKRPEDRPRHATDVAARLFPPAARGARASVPAPYEETIEAMTVQAPRDSVPPPPPLPPFAAAPPTRGGGVWWVAAMAVLFAVAAVAGLWLYVRPAPPGPVVAASPAARQTPAPTPPPEVVAAAVAAQKATPVPKPVVEPIYPVRLRIGSGLAENEKDGIFFTKPFGYIDQGGQPAIEAKWEYADQFMEGFARVRREATGGGKWGFVDPTGALALPAQWIAEGSFSEGFAAVCQLTETGKKWGFIDRQGVLVIPPAWSDVGSFSGGLASVRRGEDQLGHWGAIDRQGAVVIQPAWPTSLFFEEGLARVRKGDEKTGKWGFIDETGRTAIPFDWNYCTSFSEGLAGIRRGDEKTGRRGYIDREGRVVVPPAWGRVWTFTEGLGCVQEGNAEDGKWGYIDAAGELRLPIAWDSATQFLGGFALVRKGDAKTGKWGVINHDGEVVLPLEWDTLTRYEVCQKGPIYALGFQRTAPGRGRAAWLDAELRVVWARELELVKEKP